MKIRKLTALIACSLPILGHGLTTDDFLFESGSDNANYSLKGKPNDLYSTSNSLPTDTLTNVYSMLPEGSYVNSAFIDSTRYSNIDIDDELQGQEFATASITFLNEGAGYRNSLGYFVYDTNSPPASIEDIKEHVIIFPNASKAPDGDMQEGDTIDLNVELRSGQSLGFFVIPNGWQAGSYNNIAYLGPFDTPFYSLPHLNPETTAELRRHNVAFVDLANKFLVMGFEDIKRPSGDNDFNDLLFTVNITPFTAVDGVNIDGSTSSKYPVLVQNNNPDATVTSIYPDSNTFATMAFEDRWPLLGDYDFNDVVWQYRVVELLNGQRQVKGINIDYNLQAMGAGYSNGFALKLPNVDPVNIDTLTLTRNGNAVQHQVQQAGSETVFVVSENIKQELDALGLLTENCIYYRTQSQCLSKQPANILSYHLAISFKNPVDKDLLGFPPYDSFIFASKDKYHGDFVSTPPGMSWQTHFKSFAGTSMMNNSLFNLFDDNSGAPEYFLNKNNMPWAMNIREKWDHPTENTDISRAYKSFVNWVTSNGETSSDWYNLPIINRIISDIESQGANNE